MTNKEAEEYAKNITYRDAVYNALQGRCIPYRKATLIKLHELLDMIEPLKQEIEQTDEDCISRENALECIESAWLENEDWDFRLNVERRIKKLPSVTSQRPKGKWILIHPLQEDDDGAYICSNCEHGDWDCDTNYKYCPFCGADMRESEG